MEYMKIAVITDDRAYGEALCRSLRIGNRNADLSLLGPDDFRRRLEGSGLPLYRYYDMILWDGEGPQTAALQNLVRLTDRQSETGEKDGRFTMYRYSPSQVMTAELFGIYERLTGRRPAGTRPSGVDVTAFASWQGGSGCSLLTMAAGQELAATYGKRVLYLSLEGVESTGLFLEMQTGVKSSGEYLYHLMRDSDERTPFLEEYLIRGRGVQAFAPSAGPNPLADLSREEIDRLIPALMESGRFDCILIDCGSGTGETVREALKYADRICLVSARKEEQREERYRTFLDLLLETVRGQAPAVIRIRNRSGREAEPAEGGHQTEIRVRERDYPDPDLLLEGGFGKDIHKLTQLWYN